jgi:hypothetical protein
LLFLPFSTLLDIDFREIFQDFLQEDTGGRKTEVVSTIFSAIDITRDGVLDYNEVSSWLCNEREFVGSEAEAQAEDLFKRMDVDHNSKITFDEMQRYFSKFRIRELRRWTQVSLFLCDNLLFLLFLRHFLFVFLVLHHCATLCDIFFQYFQFFQDLVAGDSDKNRMLAHVFHFLGSQFHLPIHEIHESQLRAWIQAQQLESFCDAAVLDTLLIKARESPSESVDQRQFIAILSALESSEIQAICNTIQPAAPPAADSPAVTGSGFHGSGLHGAVSPLLSPSKPNSRRASALAMSTNQALSSIRSATSTEEEDDEEDDEESSSVGSPATPVPPVLSGASVKFAVPDHDDEKKPSLQIHGRQKSAVLSFSADVLIESEEEGDEAGAPPLCFFFY